MKLYNLVGSTWAYPSFQLEREPRWDVTNDPAKGSTSYLILEIRYSMTVNCAATFTILNLKSTLSGIIWSKLSSTDSFESINNRDLSRLHHSIHSIQSLISIISISKFNPTQDLLTLAIRLVVWMGYTLSIRNY